MPIPDACVAAPTRARPGRGLRDAQGPSPAEHPSESADLLTEALDALQVDSSSPIAFQLSDPWGIEGGVFNCSFSWTVVSGTTWVAANREQTLLRLDAGDTLILPHGVKSSGIRFLSAPDAHSCSFEGLLQQARLPVFASGMRTQPSVVFCGGRGNAVTRAVCVTYGFRNRSSGPLVAALPERMVVRAEEAGASFLQALLRLPFEFGGDRGDGEGQPGIAALSAQTARLLLVHLVRAYALRHREHGGWLGGLHDPKIARAMTAIHREPSQPWTVDRLAAVAGMSRTIFTERFMACVGCPPGHYVRSWRMHLACEALASGQQIGTLAKDLGYQSDAAFRAAFLRVVGQQPRAFRRAAAVNPSEATTDRA